MAIGIRLARIILNKINTNLKQQKTASPTPFSCPLFFSEIFQYKKTGLFQPVNVSNIVTSFYAAIYLL